MRMYGQPHRLYSTSFNFLNDGHFSGNVLGHFRVPPGLYFKTRVGAQPLIWKSFFILMQIKLIFTRKVVHLASFWKWGFLELGSGLFQRTSFKFKKTKRKLWSAVHFPYKTWHISTVVGQQRPRTKKRNACVAQAPYCLKALQPPLF